MHRIACVFATLLLAIGFGVSAFAADLPRVSGPVTGGEQGKAFSTPDFDLAKYGYVAEEFFIDGAADKFELLAGSVQGEDGKWKLRPAGQLAPYKTRVLVVRPKDARRFNGTVLAHWQNVTAGYELGSMAEGELQRGYAWVGVSVQKIGVDGVAGPDRAGLKVWDSARYGSLNHPGDEYSFDIFTQVGRAIGAKRQIKGADPMGGLKVGRVIASGGSQSAARLRTYINGVHPLDHAFDGYIPYIDFGRPSALVAAAPVARTGTNAVVQRPGVRIRDDLDVPVFVLNSETEVEGHYGVRQPDTNKYRFWEAAGTSHVSVPREIASNPQAKFRTTPISALNNPNWLSYQPAYEAAIHHMHVWLMTGKAPPTAPLVQVSVGPEVTIMRDKYGNALGGLRVPEMAAPTAEHRGTGETKPGGYALGFLYGYAKDFDAAQLRALYPASASYLRAYDAGVAAAVKAGHMMAPEAARDRVQVAIWARRLDAR